MTKPYVVHGLDLSYFTGKLEAYFRAKGIPYVLREMTTRSFADCARATGFRQMPQVECPDGTWLTDTTLIIRHFEKVQPSPAISPRDPVARFVSQLIEDFGDESLWRPALYYRWAFADDARLMSGRLARGMLRDVKLPYAARRQLILRRQQGVYLRKDGVTLATRHAIEHLYFDALTAMETALAANPFVLGERPCEADFGLFGSMFRHFFCDPTPAKIMREVAPRTLAWVARLWAIEPAQFARAAEITAVPASARALLRLAVETHLPYMQANAAAVAAGAKTVRFTDHGGSFETPVSPYRAWCFDELQRGFGELDAGAKGMVAGLLGTSAVATLSAQRHDVAFKAPALPIGSRERSRVRDRDWR
ncbi:MAG: glutathione S-transferase family protein [Alphaproteobacteria bacterium]|nr:glutathione S-transferase family protein [Alphaproteobacteria bacterium]